MKSFFFLTAIVAVAAHAGFGESVSAREAARFLDQATWGPTPASVAQVEQMGISGWLAAQFALNTSDLPDQPVLNAAGKPNENLAPVQAAFFTEHSHRAGSASSARGVYP